MQRPGSPEQSPASHAPAPDWFLRSLEIEPSRSHFVHDGARIELLNWNEGKDLPGLLFIHGNGAHADWWRWIAPFFVNRWRVAAFSLSGMGGSDHRDHYSLDGYADEVLAAAEAAGFLEGGRRCRLIAHSFGGVPATICAARHPDKIEGIVLIDSLFRARARAPSVRNTMPVYPTLAEAMSRFRLAPEQPDSAPYIVELIARTSLKEVAGEDGTSGWTWRFDPTIWGKLNLEGIGRATPQVRQPMAMIWGDKSVLSGEETISAARELAPHALHVSIPEAHHHVMVDQPIALATALRAILATWDLQESGNARR